MHPSLFSFVLALCLCTRWVVAAVSSSEIANSLNELAQQGFAAKALVLEINSTADAGPIADIYSKMDAMVAVVLTDVQFMTNTPIIAESDEQEVYEGYSNFVQSIFELMDAFSSSAAKLKSIDQTTKSRVPSEVRILQSAVDAYFYNIIGLFPADSSYNAQANNQKAQVDTHCFQAVWAFDRGYSHGLQAIYQGRSRSPLHSRRMKRGSV
ncbi:hypothetical protein N7520_004165 [Penicillium odoratum]|uniref:uncharacterized protein n=1 Tax=Penicillium odoratum TaxID=1167516 RepID=UPI002548C6B2|nr:uncharacterized protein N7520_004165 [Penicillium odoratum]KAJ5769606.1 hypothetical protein N7520_004165 [Penicillium odoratum]